MGVTLVGGRKRRRPASARALHWKWSVAGLSLAFFIGLTQIFHVNDALRGSATTAAAQPYGVAYVQPGGSDGFPGFGVSSNVGGAAIGSSAAVPHTRSGAS